MVGCCASCECVGARRGLVLRPGEMQMHSLVPTNTHPHMSTPCPHSQLTGLTTAYCRRLQRCGALLCLASGAGRHVELRQHCTQRRRRSRLGTLPSHCGQVPSPRCVVTTRNCWGGRGELQSRLRCVCVALCAGSLSHAMIINHLRLHHHRHTAPGNKADANMAFRTKAVLRILCRNRNIAAQAPN